MTVAEFMTTMLKRNINFNKTIFITRNGDNISYIDFDIEETRQGVYLIACDSKIQCRYCDYYWKEAGTCEMPIDEVKSANAVRPDDYCSRFIPKKVKHNV